MDDPFAFDPPGDSPEPDPDAEEDARLLAAERAYYLRLPADRARLEERERDLVHYLRAIGVGWDAIGTALGMAGEEARGAEGGGAAVLSGRRPIAAMHTSWSTAA